MIQLARGGAGLGDLFGLRQGSGPLNHTPGEESRRQGILLFLFFYCGEIHII